MSLCQSIFIGKLFDNLKIARNFTAAKSIN